jgi:plastocyanin
VRVKWGVLSVLAAALGAASVALPGALAAETSPTIAAQNLGIYTHYWTPDSVAVEPGASVTIENTTEVAHGVHWTGGPGTPECAPSVPVGSTEAQSGTKWSGTCTFATAGVYTFDCTVHGPAMKGTVTVGPNGSSTISTSTSPSPPPTSTPTQPPSTGDEQASAPLPLLAGPASTAVKLLAASHGAVVHGSLALGGGSEGSKLEVEVLAARAALGRHHGPANVRVAQLVRGSLSGGVVRFAISLDAAARHALHASGHLHLKVELELTGAQGGSVRLTRMLTARR